jgi:hypothetical protein
MKIGENLELVLIPAGFSRKNGPCEKMSQGPLGSRGLLVVASRENLMNQCRQI